MWVDCLLREEAGPGLGTGMDQGANILEAYLEPTGQKLVLHLQVVALVDLRLERLI